MTAAEKKAKVTFDYEAQDDDELTLHVGDVIDFMCEVEEGWWRGKLNGRVGVFPSNFVELLEEKDVAQTKDKPVEIQSKLFLILCTLIVKFVSDGSTDMGLAKSSEAFRYFFGSGCLAIFFNPRPFRYLECC